MTTEQQNNATGFASDIIKAMQEFQQSEAYGELIKKHIEKMVNDSLDTVFGYRGEYRTQFQQMLKDAMPNDISRMVDLAKYNTLFFQTLQATWADNALPDQVKKHAEKVVLDFAESFKIPEFITMTELIEAFIEENKEDAAQDGWERPYIFFKWNENSYPSDNPSFGIGMEDHKEESRFSSYSTTKEKDHAFQFKNNLYFSSTKTEHDGHKTYTLYSGRLGYTPLGNSEIKQFYSDFDKLVACLYYGGTKLVLDTEDLDDFYYPSYD